VNRKPVDIGRQLKQLAVDGFGVWSANKTVMITTTLQIDKCQYKCRWCHKLHVGPSRVLEFRCVGERELQHGLERTYEGDFSAVCECDQPLTITFLAKEYPEGVFGCGGHRSSDAEIIVEPTVREHMEILG